MSRLSRFFFFFWFSGCTSGPGLSSGLFCKDRWLEFSSEEHAHVRLLVVRLLCEEQKLDSLE